MLIRIGTLIAQKIKAYRRSVLTETHLNRIRFAVSSKIDLIQDPPIKNNSLFGHCNEMARLLEGAYRSCIIECSKDLIYLRGSAGLVKNDIVLLHTNSKALRSFYQRTCEKFSSIHFEQLGVTDSQADVLNTYLDFVVYVALAMPWDFTQNQYSRFVYEGFFGSFQIKSGKV